MKIVLVFLFTWIFLVPAAVTILLFSTLLAALLPDKYFVLLWCALMFCASLPFLELLVPVRYVDISVHSTSESHEPKNFSQEEKHEAPHKVDSRYCN
jgi:hypothetical protein